MSSTIQGYNPEAIGDAGIGEAAIEQNHGMLDSLRGTRLGTALAIAGSAFAIAGGEAINADTAEASQGAKSNGAVVKVVQVKANSVGFSNKLEQCFAEAEKEEQPAPPVDPYAECEGKVKVNVVAKAVAKCKPGWMGGRAVARASVRENIHVLAWSEAIASGRAEAKAKTLIRDRVKTKATARVNCVKLTDQQPQTPGTPTTPNTPANNKPSVDLVGPQHVLTGGIVDICAYGSDPNNDIVSRNFSETGNGNFISGVYNGDEPGEFCQTYKAGTESDTATITANVTDSANNSAADSETFPIVGSEDPRGQF